MTTALAPRTAGVAVLLVYGLLIPVARAGRPGFRLTVQTDGAVHAEAIGYGGRSAAPDAARIARESQAIGLLVEPLPNPAAPGFVIRRRPADTKEAPCPRS